MCEVRQGGDGAESLLRTPDEAGVKIGI